MSSGLYTKFNLSEKGLNATDALQKLYKPQVYQDLLLFAFASGLESLAYSPSNDSDNQIYGLLNQPISDSTGRVIQRTKFITQGRPNPDSELQDIYTFSENNLVWFDKIPSGFDKRTISETSGAPIKVSVNGSIVAASIVGSGERYVVLGEDGQAVPLPTTVNSRVIGLESGANSCVVEVTVKSDGTLDQVKGVSIVTSGSGYIDGEFLEIIPACSGEDDPSEDKCLRYTGKALYQVYYLDNRASSKALLKNEKYTYRVRFSDRSGFFLYDDNSQVKDYVFLGISYDSLQPIRRSLDPLLVIKRKDSISSENLVQLYNLNGNSAIYDYENVYRSEGSLGTEIRRLSDRAEELRYGFVNFVQNGRQPLNETEKGNNLGTKFNIIKGRSINSNYRLIFRDPDGVLDQPVYRKSGTYSQLSQTITITIAGHGLSNGDKIDLDFTTGLAITGTYTVNVIGTDVFNVTTTAENSRFTSGDVTAYKGVGFSQLKLLTDPGKTSLFGKNIPGIWLWSGEKYLRVFSSDERPFVNSQDGKYLSPAIYGINSNNELPESGSNKFSLNAGYLDFSVSSPGVSDIIGFNTQISILVQNISLDSKNGGFVYHRTLTPDPIRTGSIKAWPLFSYRDSNQIKEAKVLSI